ncbi:unnamed protein product [Rotaria sp. Silwood2]|nr:unnamed protein product [Rotaria sp. Silwood2]CAF4592670.1 unnamed protein product [Rotaria sp. Silwood2]
MLDCFCSNNEIRIINCDKLYIDVDLSSKEYSGLNIVIISQHQKLVDGKDELKIITNGKCAKNIWKHKKAKNGSKTYSTDKGKKGKDGSDGKPGKSAGHIYVVANELPEIKVLVRGGKGGKGQNGGDGAAGLDGADGASADVEALKKRISGCWAFVGGAWSYRCRRIGTDGGVGGEGGEEGDAGSGGYHGKNGDDRIVKIIALDSVSPQIESEESVEKEESEDGKPGEAGKHGKDGLDYVAISNWINPFSAAVSKRKINKLKGGRLESNYRYNEEEETDYEDYDMLPFKDDKDNVRFRHKYKDRHAEKGASSFQHWLAPGLNDFLVKMAALEGLPPYKVYTLPDIENDAKQILILKEKFSQLVNSENQRLHAQKLDTEQMSIGIVLLAQNVLNEYNQFLKQYQVVYQQL